MHNLASATLADAVHYLLVCKHALARGAEVYGHFFFICQPVLVELEEYPLRPLDIFGVGGVYLSVPVKAEAEHFELLLEMSYVLLCDICGMHFILYRIIFRRQTESVPAHREKHIIALHSLLTCHYVHRRIGARMPYMQSLTGGIRKFDKRIVFRLALVYLNMESLLVVPDFLPFPLNGGVVVFHLYFRSPFKGVYVSFIYLRRYFGSVAP
ncbi:putative uncharacterized protein [Candidatus Apopatosoma intestinale]|nr:putative uncharacterized protein [Candidatus Apopatosoma intestinale]